MRARRTLSAMGVGAMVAAVLLAAPLPPAHAASTATLSGVVTLPDGSALDGPVSVILSYASVYGTYRVVTTNAAAGGEFTFANLPAATYRLVFEYNGPNTQAASFAWPSAPADASLGSDVVVGDGAAVDLGDIPFPVGGRISGSLTGGFGELGSARLLVYVAGPTGVLVQSSVTAFDPTTDTFTTEALPAGSYVLGFNQPFDSFRNQRLWFPEYSGDATVREDATPVDVTSGATTIYDVQVTGSPTLSGSVQVRDVEGALSDGPGVAVLATRANGESAVAVTDANGDYHFPGLYANEPLTVCAGGTGPQNYVRECWSEGDIDVINLDYNESAEDVDFIVDQGGQITGHATYQYNGIQNVSGAEAELWLNDSGHFELVATDVIYAGAFEFRSVAPGTYVVRVDATGVGNSYAQFNSEYWDDARFAWEADPVVVTGGSATDLDFALDGRSVEVSRVTGADRFGTSVQVSQLIFGSDDVPADGIPVVYLANGLNYPDALAAGPAAIESGGVVLLTFPWSLPPVVAAELERLRPQRIVVVGGEPSVSSSVEAALDDLSFDPEVERITGLDRFGTSREIARDTYPGGADIAFIATGLNYPDALAAGPPAGMLEAPIILVNGGSSSLDQATIDLLDDLGVSEVYVIGGTPSVSAAIFTQLQGLPGLSHVTRLTGTDRFGTAIAISQEFYTDADVAFLATGLNFPDALAGGPAAGYFGGPLYLSRQDCVQAAVVDDIFDVRANGLVLLGGPPSLSMNVQNGVICG